MNYVRWYDKNPNLKEVFDFIQNLDADYQDAIAQDIIQILMSDFKLDLDYQIKQIASNYNYNCKRWYDNNIDLFTSFEIIKNLDSELQQEVIQKIIVSALFIYLEDTNNV